MGTTTQRSIHRLAALVRHQADYAIYVPERQKGERTGNQVFFGYSLYYPRGKNRTNDRPFPSRTEHGIDTRYLWFSQRLI